VPRLWREAGAIKERLLDGKQPPLVNNAIRVCEQKKFAPSQGGAPVSGRIGPLLRLARQGCLGKFLHDFGGTIHGTIIDTYKFAVFLQNHFTAQRRKALGQCGYRIVNRHDYGSPHAIKHML